MLHTEMAFASTLTLVLVTIALVSGQAPGDQAVQKRDMPHLCGKNLIEALSMVCGWNVGKRSAAASLSENQLFGEIDEQRRLELPTGDVTSSADMTSLRQRVLQTLFTPHSQERRLYASGQRNKRSIVDECCFQPCKLQTLQLYC